MTDPAPASFGRNTLHESTSPTASYVRTDEDSHNVANTRFSIEEEEEACFPDKSPAHTGSSRGSRMQVDGRALALAGFSQFGGAASTFVDVELDEDIRAQSLRPWRRTTWYIFATVFGANVWVVVSCLLVAMMYSEVLALSVVAYIRGLCRGFDVSHIAVVSGILRQLLLHGLGWPAGVGLWFSLGNSAVVLVVAGEAFATRGLEVAEQRIIIATSHAASTCATTAALYSFGLLNVQLAASVFMSLKGRGSMQAAAVEQYASGCGRVCRGQDWARCSLQSVRLVDTQWKVFLAGMLFGLSSASAAAVAPSRAEMHAIGADQQKHKVAPPPWSFLPSLAFGAGLALADATSCLLTLEAYGWATSDPLYKLGYNAVITVVPAAAALLTGVRDSTALLLLLFRKPGEEVSSLLRDLHPGEMPGLMAGLALMVAMVCSLLSSILAFKCWPRFRRARSARRAGFQSSVELTMNGADRRDEEVFAERGVSSSEYDPELDPLAWG